MKILEERITAYSKRNGYEATHFAEAVCSSCGAKEFQLLINANEGVAARICGSCESEHGIGDSDDFIDEVDEVFPVECECGGRTFSVVCGVSLYEGGEDVRWFYLACHCPACNDAAVYADWKNEFIGYTALLARV